MWVRYSASTLSSAPSKLSTFQTPCPPRGLAISLTQLRSGKESFVVKRVPSLFYDLSLRLTTEFAGSRRLRMHIDRNQENSILVYPYFRSTLLALIREDPDFPLAERKKNLQRTGEAIQELHSKNWIHIGTLSIVQKSLSFKDL